MKRGRYEVRAFQCKGPGAESKLEYNDTRSHPNGREGPENVGPRRTGMKSGFYLKSNEERLKYSKQRTGTHRPRPTARFSYLSCFL